MQGERLNRARASGAVAVLCAKEAKSHEDPKAFLAEKEEEYTEMFANPYQAAQYGYIDDVIEPRNTRFRICRGLAQLATKRQSLPAKKHGCMPMELIIKTQVSDLDFKPFEHTL